MKLSTSATDLLAQLQSVARVASNRSAVQALGGIQIHATTDGVELRSTDLEVALRVPLSAKVESPGEVVVPARLFLDIARSVSSLGEAVSIEHRPEPGDIALKAGTAEFHIRTLRNDDFPKLPQTGEGETVVLPGDALVATIDKVARSASRDETRPILTGILMSATGSELRMVATDSYRLSVKRTKLETPIEPGFEANVPARALEELRTVVTAAGAAEVSISVTASQIVFEVAGVVLSSRLIDGQFPSFQQLLPDSFEHELRLNGDEIAGVVGRVALMAQKNTPLRLSFTEGELTVSAQTPDVGEASEPLPVPFSGEPFEIGFNPEFLRDGLDSMAGEDLLLKLISPLRPGLIEAADDSGFVYLIMPIRLNV
ncbi:MAG TPA: DNA polymerase III subunit beta [Baekduia sp.]|nr:DNA polymerase III subunit beta [Baekduia sp.]